MITTVEATQTHLKLRRACTFALLERSIANLVGFAFDLGLSWHTPSRAWPTFSSVFRSCIYQSLFRAPTSTIIHDELRARGAVKDISKFKIALYVRGHSDSSVASPVYTVNMCNLMHSVRRHDIWRRTARAGDAHWGAQELLSMAVVQAVASVNKQPAIQ